MKINPIATKSFNRYFAKNTVHFIIPFDNQFFISISSHRRKIKMYKIFDIHTHTYPEAISEKAVKALNAFYEFVSEGDGTYKGLTKGAREAGVEGFLLFSVATNAHQVEKVNNGIAAQVKASIAEGFKTVGFAGMHQDYPDMEAEIERCIKMGLRGVKIHPDIQGVDIDDERMMRLYEIIEGRIPVYFHIGDNRPQYQFSQPRKLRKVLDTFPRLEAVAAHLGGYMSWDETANCLAGHERVWYDTSSALWAMTPEFARKMIGILGHERVMFGTDFPVKTLDTEIERFLAIDLTEREREDILYNNAVRFLGL